MSPRSTVERALELARAGACRTIDDVRRQLRLEQHTCVDAHLAGAAIRKQLKVLMRGEPADFPLTDVAPATMPSPQLETVDDGNS